MFDIFYSGIKPNLFPHEQQADSIEHAQQLSRTRYFWWVNYLTDYSGWDFIWEPVPWQSDQRHAWPSQWQKDSGTYLVPRRGYKETNYKTDTVLTRRSSLDSWIIPDTFDIECIMESCFFLFALDLACISHINSINPYLDSFKSSNGLFDFYAPVLVLIPLFRLVNNSCIIECLYSYYELVCKSDFPVMSIGAAILIRLRMVGATSAKIPLFNSIPVSSVTKITGTGFKLCAVFGVPSAFKA